MFYIEEMHVGGMNIKNNIESLEKDMNQKSFWKQTFGTYIRYLISKGNPSNTTGDENIIIVTSAE
jgi:hypothetical protein